MPILEQPGIVLSGLLPHPTADKSTDQRRIEANHPASYLSVAWYDGSKCRTDGCAGGRTGLCSQFTTWQNEVPPHQRLSGATPADKYRDITRIKPSRTSKAVADNIECVSFPEARMSGWRLKRTA